MFASDVEVTLTALEFKLLTMLYDRRGRVLSFVGLLALVWRAGATRYGHWSIFFGFVSLLPFCAICLRRTASALADGAVVAFALLSTLFFLGAVHAGPGFLLSEAKAAMSSNTRALFHRKSFVIQRKEEWLAFEKSVVLPRIKAAVGEDPVDLLMTDQGIVLAMGLHYDPRPVFQSYSAYTPELARRNEAHFANANAPRFVILKMQPIDGRLPMQEDGLALTMLLRRYRPLIFRCILRVSDALEPRVVRASAERLPRSRYL